MESWWIQVSSQVLLEVGKWKGCTSEPENQERLCSLDGGTPDCLQLWLLFCLTDDKTEFFPSWLSLYFVVVGGFFFLLGLKGCDRTAEGLPLLFLAVAACVRWTVRRKRRRLQCLHAHGKTPDKAHGLLVSKEQICSQTSEVKERIHSWRPRGRLWRLLQPRKQCKLLGSRASGRRAHSERK